MTNYERMKVGRLFQIDSFLRETGLHMRELQNEYNATPYAQKEKWRGLLKEMFASVGEGSYIHPPVYCDYGIRIQIGAHTFINYGCTMLDQGGITIGDHVMIGPNVGLYTPSHPIDPEVRSTGLELGHPIVIEDQVWIGGSAVINPGVTIGCGSVIGSGSVVTKDVPPGVIAAGNPCRILRKITEADRDYWMKEMEDYRQDPDTGKI